MKELEGKLLPYKLIEINAAGVVNSNCKMKSQDGFNYFGSENYKDEDINDVNLNINLENKGKYLFIILFYKELNRYYLKSYYDKKTYPVILLKITKEIVFFNKFI